MDILKTYDFDQIADLILNRSILYIKQVPHLIQEIEFYLKTQEHPDPFVHGHPDQKQFGYWYFHKVGTVGNPSAAHGACVGNSYKGGTYKGLDLAFGDENTYAGMLIRSIFRPDKSRFYEGPSVCVDRILKLNKRTGIDRLMKDFDGFIGEKDGSPLYLKIGNENRGMQIHQSSRVGLTLRKTDDVENRLKYIFKPYRYFLFPRKHTKGKMNIFAALYARGMDYYQIQQLMPTLKKKTFEQYQKDYEEGKGRQPEEFLGNKLSLTKDFLGVYAILEKS